MLTSIDPAPNNKINPDSKKKAKTKTKKRGNTFIVVILHKVVICSFRFFKFQ